MSMFCDPVPSFSPKGTLLKGSSFQPFVLLGGVCCIAYYRICLVVGDFSLLRAMVNHHQTTNSENMFNLFQASKSRKST